MLQSEGMGDTRRTRSSRSLVVFDLCGVASTFVHRYGSSFIQIIFKDVLRCLFLEKMND